MFIDHFELNQSTLSDDILVKEDIIYPYFDFKGN